MNIGIVTTWFERGAAYVSKQYMEVLQQEHNVFIYARSGESYADDDPEWNLPNVYWSKKLNSPFTVTVICKQEFFNWIKVHKIEALLFNEQHWWEPLIWCKELGIKTIAYVDYYTEETLPLFEIYDLLICNTRKHFEAFSWHEGARYIPWGTDTALFAPKGMSKVSDQKESLVFFHSCGLNPKRKGTDLLLKAIPLLNSQCFKVIIHTQTDLKSFYPKLSGLIVTLLDSGKLEIINETVNAPGLYHLGDVYVYPSRLEGIGLTVAEAISCGLPVIVPDCAPMNEFVQNEVSRVVKVERYFSRHDGYYWPQNEVNIVDLAAAMEYFIANKSSVIENSEKSRTYALQNLDWYNNATEILNLVLENTSRPQGNIKKNIQEFERKGLRKYNKFYLKAPLLFHFLFKK